MVVPDGTHLYREERSPTHNISRNDHEGHFDGADLSAGDTFDAADMRREEQSLAQGALAWRSPFSLLQPRLVPDVAPDVVTDEAVAGGQDEDGNHQDTASHPSDVGASPPRLDEVRPAVIDLRVALHLAEGEDEVLGHAEQEAERPGGRDHAARALARLLQRLERVAHGDVPIGRHHH